MSTKVLRVPACAIACVATAPTPNHALEVLPAPKENALMCELPHTRPNAGVLPVAAYPDGFPPAVRSEDIGRY